MNADKRLAQLTGAYLLPISEGAPAGAPPDEDPRYIAVMELIRLIRSPGWQGTGQQIEKAWTQIESDASGVLQTASKDFVLAAVLAHAMHVRRGVPGLVLGLAVLRGLLEGFWDDLHPTERREKRCTAALRRLFADSASMLAGAVAPGGWSQLLEQQMFALDAIVDSRLPKARSEFERMKTAAVGLGVNGSVTSDALGELAADFEGRSVAAVSRDGESKSLAGPPDAPAADAGPQGGGNSTLRPPPRVDLLAAVRVSLEEWLQPIAGDAPVGRATEEDPRHDAVFRQARVLDSPYPEHVKWGEILRDGGDLLREVGKDIVIAVFVARAFLYTDENELGGLVRGFVLIGELLRRFGDRLYPARPKRRVAALTGFIRVAEGVMERAHGRLEHRADLEAIAQAATALEEQLVVHLGDEAPTLARVSRRVRDLVEAIDRPPVSSPVEAAKEPGPAKVEVPQRDTSAPPSSSPRIDLPDLSSVDGEVFLRDAGEGLAKLAANLRRTSPTDPSAYRLLRIGLWLHITNPPPNNGGRTKIQPPPGSLLSKMAGMTSNARWSSLIEEIEGQVTRHCFALDLHRSVAMALGQLGTPYAAAREAVQEGVRSLIVRLKGLEHLLFVDGTPFANRETKHWLDEIRGTAHRRKAPAEDDVTRKVRAKADELAQGGGLEDALKLLRREASTQVAGLARFQLDFHAAKLAAGAGRRDLALGLFVGVDEQSKAVNLDHWDPPLCAEFLAAYMGVLLGADGNSQGLPAGAEIVYGRLARIDPVAAMGFRLPG